MARQQLKRVLGEGFAIAACVGGVVGLGIMRTPGEIAATITDPVTYMSLWIGGGLLELVALLVIVELIAMTPKSGGTYALVASSFGPYPGFLVGWIAWLTGGAIAALKTVVLMEYLALLVPALSAFALPGALIVTTAFACFQIGGVRMGARYHQIAVSCMGLMILAIIAALFLGGGTTTPSQFVSGTGPGIFGADLSQFGIVVAAVVFTYSGSTSVSFFGGEIKGSGRNAALGSLYGLWIVIALYLLLNLGLVLALPLESLQGHEIALAGAIEFLYGAGTPIVFVAVFFLLTHQNFDYMRTPRALYAISVDGMGTESATPVTEKGTPFGAVLITWGFIVLLILGGGFEFLLGLSAIMYMLTRIALIVAVFYRRRRDPHAERPYRARGFPATGYIGVTGWVLFTLFFCLTSPETALYALALIAISIPAFLWLKSRRQIDVSLG